MISLKFLAWLFLGQFYMAAVFHAAKQILKFPPDRWCAYCQFERSRVTRRQRQGSHWSWNLTVHFSRPGKSWNWTWVLKKSWKSP